MSESTNSFAGLKDMAGVVTAETAAPKREPKRDAQGRS
ncbi:MAG: 30S ribosomal protein S9, partial [Acidocella sp. 20-61-6]